MATGAFVFLEPLMIYRVLRIGIIGGLLILLIFCREATLQFISDLAIFGLVALFLSDVWQLSLDILGLFAYVIADRRD
jgi:hypothetical protein